MYKCTNGYVYQQSEAYIESIRLIRRNIRKEFNDMDLENVDIRQIIEQHIEEIENECDRLIRRINNIR